MVNLLENGAYLLNLTDILPDDNKNLEFLKARTQSSVSKEEAKNRTLTYQIINNHNISNNKDKIKIRFDAMSSSDITYVNIIQTARACGLNSFPVPFVLSSCHNSLGAIGGTINEDDHVFGLSCAKKYGGIFIPANVAVLHQYMREMIAGCGQMILGSDNHSRYGALGALAISEGGGMLVKQLLGHGYEMGMPDVIGVYLTGAPEKGVGPHDVALSIIKAVYENGFVKDKVMEFIGDGIKNLSVEYRNAIDVMTAEAHCLSSIWATDQLVSQYLQIHGRQADYKELKPGNLTYYDGMIIVDLSQIKPVIAMPFHPSNVYTIEEFNQNMTDIIDSIERKVQSSALSEKIIKGQFVVDQAIIGGCVGGTFENICDCVDILKKASIGFDEFSLTIYPASQPTYYNLIESGVISQLIQAGAIIRPSACGACYGVSDVPGNGAFSIRHTTRNFLGYEGSQPSNGQVAFVGLMDARSIAATACNKGVLTAATDIDTTFTKPKYYFKKSLYDNRVYNGSNNADLSIPLKISKNISNWPVISPLSEDILIKAVTVLQSESTTTEDLLPTGETVAFRSCPEKLCEYLLKYKDPSFYGKARDIKKIEDDRQNGRDVSQKYDSLKEIYAIIFKSFGAVYSDVAIGTAICANKIGAGSPKEQAASCQRVLGTLANIAKEYPSKKYVSNLINWGIIPFILNNGEKFDKEDYIYIPDIKDALINKFNVVKAYNVSNHLSPLTLKIAEITNEEREILLAGGIINFYKL